MGILRKTPKTPEELIRKTARKFGVSEQTVREEIKSSIRMGFFSPDPKERAKMASVPCEGEMPTPEELITYLLRRTGGGKES